MTKKQLLATCLAGALTLGCISGCNNNQKRKETILCIDNEYVENNFTLVSQEYITEEIDAIEIVMEDGRKMNAAPNSEWVLNGDKCFRLICRTTYKAKETVLEDGSVVCYNLNSKNISGTRIYIDTVVKEDENKLTLK